VSGVNVGDGACTVIRSRRDGEDSLTVVDCGSDSISADDACDRLLDTIDGRPELIETIVVTHFDADHYLGFVRLAERMRARGQRFHSLRLISPRPPDVEPSYTVAYLAMATTMTGLRSLDLAGELAKATAGRFRYMPLARGAGGAFLASGRGYEVAWPLPLLPPGVASQVRNAVSGFEELAQSLADNGNTVLLDNFEAAQSGGWLRSEDTTGESAVDVGSPDDGLNFQDFRDVDEPEEDEEDHLKLSRLDLPEHLRGAFTRVWNAMRRANNNMSLVFEDTEPGRLIVFGDASRPVLSWLAKTDLSPGHYALMLAPHHGTHPLPAGLRVTADLCVAQNGAKRVHLWQRHRATHRNSGRCVSSTAGSYHLVM
jgi:hypothetical protein